MTFLHGRIPTLYLKDDNGSTLETIDLSSYSTTQLHQLMVQKGLKKKEKSFQNDISARRNLRGTTATKSNGKSNSIISINSHSSSGTETTENA